MPSVLIVGDSHVDPVAGPSANRLRKALQGAGWTVTLAGVGSTSTGSWSGTKACVVGGGRCQVIDDLPRGTDLLLVSLGTNDAANASAGKYKGKFAKETYFDAVVDRVIGLAQRMGAARTIWLLPPWQRGNHKHYNQPAMDLLYDAAPRAAANGIELLDARPVTQSLVQGGDGDGIHLGKAGSDAWAAAVVAKVKGGAAAPGKRSGGVSFGVLALLAAPLAVWLYRSRK